LDYLTERHGVDINHALQSSNRGKRLLFSRHGRSRALETLSGRVPSQLGRGLQR